MDLSTAILAFLGLGVFGVLAWREGVGAGLAGSRAGLQLFLETVPRLFFAFVLTGLIQVLLPSALVARWLSDSAGFRAILIASAAGALTPGGPFLQFPMVAAIYTKGVGVGSIVAYLTAWSLMGIHRILLWELPFLGPRLTLTRVLCSLPFPLVAGFATRWAQHAMGWSGLTR